MAIPVVVPIVLGVGALGAIGLRMRALSQQANALKVLQTPSGIQGFKSQQELDKEQAATKAAVAALTPQQLAVVDQKAVVGITVADFDSNAEQTLTGLQAENIFPTDRVTISVAAAGLNIPSVPRGSILIRATKFNTADKVFGVVIDPRLVGDPSERSFPLSSVTGIGPVDLSQGKK